MATLAGLQAKQEHARQSSTVSYKYTVHQLEVVGDRAFRCGTATETDRPKNAKAGLKAETAHLKFVDVWKKGSGGKWHIYRDSSAFDMPPALQNLIKSCVQAQRGGKKAY